MQGTCSFCWSCIVKHFSKNCVCSDIQLCGSRKYPYPHGWFFSLSPSTPLEFPFQRVFSRPPTPKEFPIFFKDLHANCLCASLLRTQFMSQHHATSCTSARAKEEVYSYEGMVAVALTLLRFNSLRWSVTPTCFLVDDFLYQFSIDCEKMNQKSM